MPPKKKVKAKKKDGGKKSPERPNEKELLETKIHQLREELKSVDEDLQQHKSTLVDVKARLNTESNSKAPCVAHLERTLQDWHKKRLQIQEKLDTVRDLAQLAQRRVRVQLENVERDARVAKSIFLQQKGELEGKLSLLEDLRQERKKDLEKLRKDEQSIQESRVLAQEKARYDEREKFEKLLEVRRTFTQMCREELRDECTRVHMELRVPVYAERQLSENVRLRGECERTTEELMKVQNHKRNLKKLLKSVEQEQEIQSSTEQLAHQKKALQEERLLHLRHRIQQLNICTEDPSSIPEREKQQSPNSTENSQMIDQRIDAIRKNEVEQCRMADWQSETDAIFKDQTNYKSSLERQIEKTVDRNGVMMSALLRAGKVFQARTECSFDIELLNQIRELLNLASSTAGNDLNVTYDDERRVRDNCCNKK